MPGMGMMNGMMPNQMQPQGGQITQQIQTPQGNTQMNQPQGQPMQPQQQQQQAPQQQSQQVPQQQQQMNQMNNSMHNPNNSNTGMGSQMNLSGTVIPQQPMSALPSQNGTGNTTQVPQENSGMQTLTSVMGMNGGTMNMSSMPVFNPLTNSWNAPQQQQPQNQQQQQSQQQQQQQQQVSNQNQTQGQNQGSRNDTNNNNGDDGSSFSYGGNLAHCA